MARESRKKTCSRYRSLIDASRRWREEEQYDAMWWRMIDMYRGRQVDDLTPEDRITVNIAFGTLNVIFPAVSVNYPKITVAPTTPEDEDRAPIVEALANYFWRHHDYQPEFRSAVKDYLMMGHGWLKVGYSYEEEEVALTEDEQADEYARQVVEAEQAAATTPEMAGEMPTDDEIYEHLVETKMVPTEDQPFVERVSPFDMFVDTAATTVTDARWMAQRIVRPINEVRQDENFNKGAREKVSADRESNTHREDGEWRKRERQNPEVEYCTIWEFYDLQMGTLAVFADGGDEFLVDPHKIPFAFGQPYVMLRNYDVPEHFYPMGDLEAIEPLQLELNQLRSQFAQARKKYARKYLIRESAFNDAGREALESDEDNTIVPVKDEMRDFEHLIMPLAQIPLPPDLYQDSQQIEQDIATVSGVSEYMRGQVPETRRTATEAAIISDSVSARSADKLAVIERALGDVARRVVQVTQQYCTGEQVFLVTGVEGASVWVPWTFDDIVGEYDFEVEAGSTQPMNETVRRQTAVAMSQALAPFISMGVVNPAEVAKYLLQFGFGIKNVNKFVQPMPMMMPGMDPSMGGGPPGVGGMQEAPMGGGNIDQETGNNANEELDEQAVSGIPQELLTQLAMQVGYQQPGGGF